MTARSSNGSSYALSGPEGAPVVALIHGLGLNRNVWEQYLPALAARYRVLNYDLYGHGESAPPPTTPDLALFSEQLLELLDELDIEQCTLVGFSLGGMINRRFAIDHAERVSALAILNSPHERTPEAQKLVEERAADSTAGPGATLDATIERWFTTEFRTANPEYIQQVRDWVLANDATLYARCRQVLATGVIELINPRPPITHPTLVITCENDSGSTLAMTHGIASEIVDSQVIVAPALQHMGLVENPSFFITAIAEYLEDVLAR